MSYALTCDAVPLYVKALGRKHNVEVVIGGDKAATNGKTVYIPAVDPTDSDAALLTYAYCAHEVSHIRYSDMDELATRIGQMTETKRSLTNVLMDAVDERQIIRDYPGIRHTFSRAYKRLVEEGFWEPVEEGAHPAAKLHDYLLYRMRSQILGQEAFSGLAVQAEAQARKTFSPGCMAKLGSVIARAGFAAGNQDVCRLADDILNILKDEAEKKDPPPPPEKDDGEGVQDQSASLVSEETTSAGEKEAAAQVLVAQGSETGKDTGAVLSEALNEKAVEAEKSSGGYGAGAGVALADLPMLASQDPDLVSSVNRATNALRHRLQSLVESSREEEESNSCSGCNIDDFLVDRIPLGETAVFTQEIDIDAVDTAVLVLLDRSGSMRSGIETARRAALAIGMALEQIQDLVVSVAAFPAHSGHTGVIPLTLFGESPKRTAGRYAVLNASGGTPMSEAIWWALDQLVQRHESRKMLFVVTDGRPDNPKTADHAIAAGRSLGVELYGIGVGKTDVTERFDQSAEIETVDQLASMMFKLLQKSLSKSAA